MAVIRDGNGYDLGTLLPNVESTAAGVSVVSELVDFAKIKTDRETAGAAALAVNDVLFIMPLPGGSLVTQMYIRVLTSEGSSNTVDVSIGSTSVQSNFQLNQAAGLYALTGARTAVSADEDVKISLDAVPDTAVIRVFAIVHRLEQGGG